MKKVKLCLALLSLLLATGFFILNKASANLERFPLATPIQRPSLTEITVGQSWAVQTNANGIGIERISFSYVFDGRQKRADILYRRLPAPLRAVEFTRNYRDSLRRYVFERLNSQGDFVQ